MQHVVVMRFPRNTVTTNMYQCPVLTSYNWGLVEVNFSKIEFDTGFGVTRCTKKWKIAFRNVENALVCEASHCRGSLQL